jgi:uncharacterized membrane protein
MVSKKIIGKIFSYFIQGLLLVAPIFLTGQIIFSLFQWLDSKFYFWFPGAGLLTVLVLIVSIGFVGSTFISIPVYGVFDSLIKRIPLAGVIYSSIRDLIDAFVGDKRKFDQPVLFLWNKESNIHKIGFMTQQSLEDLSLKEYAAVYCPHSYAFSGELYVVPIQHIKTLDLPTAQAMKFIVSGGVSMAEEDNEEENKENNHFK